MLNELFIGLYLAFIRFFFFIFSFVPVRKKTVILSSFGDNTYVVAQKLVQSTSEPVIVLQTGHDQKRYDALTLKFEPKNLISFIRGIYHLATSQLIFIDNYFPCLAAMPFKKSVKCVQLWHAAGAVKRFALLDPSVQNRTKQAKKRFETVYHRFTDAVVGSEKMTTIFRQTFGNEHLQIVRTGIPRTDLFFDERLKDEITKQLQQRYPLIKERQVLLYAPTFRDNELNDYQLQLDIEHMYQSLSDKYCLLIKLHPAVKTSIDTNYNDFVIDVSSYPDLNELLLITDILITDYSSACYEFALLERPMIFYAYDLENYEKSRGFFEDYNKGMPGPVVRTTKEIVSHILENDLQIEKVAPFNDAWNTYSTGRATENLIQTFYKDELKTESKKAAY